ncbi:MAG: copper homeostasis periplasmic binding protein CopC [Asticcacaulis sp.]|jgi:methionine-rich copper-binding protein CopC|uniref:copper homeostasis periplasmic binding protein CopC n=1 Tax=Asticcacaulis sp. TaxID=1872648 RepID=UPI003F7CAC46
MKTLIRTAVIVAAIAAPFAATFTASGAFAHARLISAMPTDGSTGASPSMIMLTFNEKLTPKLSGFEVAGADGKALDLKIMTAGGGKAMHAMPTHKLTAGAYKVTWHAVSDDGHRTEGATSFTVK